MHSFPWESFFFAQVSVPPSSCHRRLVFHFIMSLGEHQQVLSMNDLKIAMTMHNRFQSDAVECWINKKNFWANVWNEFWDGPDRIIVQARRRIKLKFIFFGEKEWEPFKGVVWVCNEAIVINFSLFGSSDSARRKGRTASQVCPFILLKIKSDRHPHKNHGELQMIKVDRNWIRCVGALSDLKESQVDWWRHVVKLFCIIQFSGWHLY